MRDQLMTSVERVLTQEPAEVLECLTKGMPTLLVEVAHPLLLEDVLEQLIKLGCVPGMYRRGKVWRVHINTAGNYWAENENPVAAFCEAFKMWHDAGRPKDGHAAVPSHFPEE